MSVPFWQCAVSPPKLLVPETQVNVISVPCSTDNLGSTVTFSHTMLLVEQSPVTKMSKSFGQIKDEIAFDYKLILRIFVNFVFIPDHQRFAYVNSSEGFLDWSARSHRQFHYHLSYCNLLYIWLTVQCHVVQALSDWSLNWKVDYLGHNQLRGMLIGCLS